MKTREENEKPVIDDAAEALLAVVRQVSMELHPHSSSIPSATMDSSLEVGAHPVNPVILSNISAVQYSSAGLEGSANGGCPYST